jgi:hypothetical protein
MVNTRNRAPAAPAAAIGPLQQLLHMDAGAAAALGPCSGAALGPCSSCSNDRRSVAQLLPGSCSAELAWASLLGLCLASILQQQQQQQQQYGTEGVIV